jgi:hypothetical protein
MPALGSCDLRARGEATPSDAGIKVTRDDG